MAPIPESEAELEQEEEDINEKDLGRNDERYLPNYDREGNGAVDIPISGSVEGTDIGSSRKSCAEGIALEAQSDPISPQKGLDQKFQPASIPAAPGVAIPPAQSKKANSNGWQAIPKPKGHSALDYARWDSVEDNSSEDESDDEDEEESQPQYRFRVRTVGVRPVK